MGLKEIAKEVNELIIEEQSTNYKRISDKLVSQHKFTPKDSKNIKRRVYDALNVIKAIRDLNSDLNDESLKLENQIIKLEKRMVRLF